MTATSQGYHDTDARPSWTHAPNATLLTLAARYRAAHGMAEPTVTFAPYDAAFGAITATAYDALRTDNPAAHASYDAFARETITQYDALMAGGYILVPSDLDPYPDSAAMMADVREYSRLIVYTGGDPHPYLTGTVNRTFIVNVAFRAVHDLFGHAAHGYQFGPRGEYNAMLHHASMYSPLARLALYTETHGQNSVYQRDGTFAPQRADILPSAIIAAIEATLAERTAL